MKKEAFEKELKALFAKAGVNKLDTDSKDVFSYNNKTDYTVLFNNRLSIFLSLTILTLLVQMVAIAFHVLLPEPVYYLTTFNGHVYQIPDPKTSLDEAVLTNKSIKGQVGLIKAETE